MALVVALQAVFLVVTFVLTLLCVLLPLRLVRLTSARAHRLIAFANCLSGGVFLGTCYAQLIPFIDDKFLEVFAQAGWSTRYVSTTTQCTICVGFYLILTIEQLVKVCQKKPAKPLPETESEEVAIPLDVSADYGTSTGSDDSETDTSTDSKQNMIRKTAPNGNAHVNENGNAHGHSHAGNGAHGHSHLADMVHEDFGLRCLLLLAALSVHSLFEGLAVGLQEDLLTLINLFVGVLIHECLMSFAMGTTLAQQRLKVSTVIKLCVAYSLTIPVGMGLGMAIGGIQNFAGNLASAIIQAITAGTFVYVIFLEILPPEINSEKDRLWKVVFLFLGFLLIFCLRIALDSH